MTFIQKHFLSRGISLLEVLLVLLVAAILVLFGYDHYQKSRQDKDLVALKTDRDALLYAVTVYYRKHAPNIPSPEIPGSYKKELKDQAENLWPGLWPSKNVQTGFIMPTALVQYPGTDTSYDVNLIPILVVPRSEANPLGKTIYQLVAKITLNPSLAGNMEWYKNALGATESSGTTLIWRQMPNQTIQSIRTNLWIMKSTLQEFKENAPSTS